MMKHKSISKIYASFIMPSYSGTYRGNCIWFTNGESFSTPTLHHNRESEMVGELIDYLVMHETPSFLKPEYYLAQSFVDTNEYAAFIKTQVHDFKFLILWCETYSEPATFNNFETGWSISMSVYSQ